jgi:hypothetical protein
MINIYLRFRTIQLREARLVRAIALQRAEPPASSDL